MNMLNQKEKINLEYLMNVVLDYGKNKMQFELMKMEKMGKAL